MQEVQGVGRAKGVDVPDAVVERQMTFARALEPMSTSSMQRDADRGNNLELETLNGTVVRLGRALDVPTPVNAEVRRPPTVPPLTQRLSRPSAMRPHGPR